MGGLFLRGVRDGAIGAGNGEVRSVFIPSGMLGQGIPLLHGTLIGDLRQNSATVERIVSDVRDACRNNNGSQIGAPSESIFINCSYTVGNSDGGQIIARIERAVANEGHTVGNSDLGETIAISECALVNARYTVV